MTKHDEIAEAARSGINKWTEWQMRCFKHMNQFVNGFIKYCQIPTGMFRLVPLDEQPKEGTQYSVIGASHLGEDGYWHAGLRITTAPPKMVLIEVGLTERAGKVLVKLGADDKPRQIDLNDQKQCQAVYDEIVEDIKHFYTDEPKFGESFTSIGFKASGADAVPDTSLSEAEQDGK